MKANRHTPTAYAGVGLIVLVLAMLLQCSPAPRRPDSTAGSSDPGQTEQDTSMMAADSSSTVAADSAMMLPPDETASQPPPPPPPPPPVYPSPPPPPELPDEYMKNRVALYNDTEQDVIVKIGPSMDELRPYKVKKYDNYVSDEYETSPVISIRTGNKRPRVSRFVRGNTYHIVWKTASKCFDIE